MDTRTLTMKRLCQMLLFRNANSPVAQPKFQLS